MTATRTVRRIAVGVGAVAVALLGPTPVPAAADEGCERVGLKEAVARGYEVVLVHNVSYEYGDSTSLDVERAGDPSIPDRFLVAGVDQHCRFDIGAHSLGAIAVELSDGQWRKVIGSQIGLDEALRHLEGPPSTRSHQPPVAVAVGDFAGARMGTLDRTGRVVAWDRRPGFGLAVAVCPGGERVASVGGATKDSLDISVHDVRTLAVERTVDVPGRGGELLAMACRDAAGDRVDFLVKKSRRGTQPGRLVTVRGGAVQVRQIPGLGYAATPTTDGFLVATESPEPPAIARLDADGGQQVLFRYEGETTTNTYAPEYRFGPEDLKLSRDGRTLAVVEYENGGGYVYLSLHDSRSGQRLFRKSSVFPGDIEWTRSGRLAFRSILEDRDRPILVFDESLRGSLTRTTPHGDFFAAIGNDMVAYGSSPMIVYPADGSRARTVAEPRLAGTVQLVELPGLGNLTFAPAPDPVLTTILFRPSTDDGARTLLQFAFYAAFVGLGLAAARNHLAGVPPV
ncbi:MAG: hypothetical protein ACT4QF_20295 [Sporichthyaceae bacterium]